jgi:hypothetical protein
MAVRDHVDVEFTVDLSLPAATIRHELFKAGLDHHEAEEILRYAKATPTLSSSRRRSP